MFALLRLMSPNLATDNERQGDWPDRSGYEDKNPRAQATFRSAAIFQEGAQNDGESNAENSAIRDSH